MAEQVRMLGVDALVAKLEGLKYDVARKGGRFALRKAAQVVRNAARHGARRLDDPGTDSKIYENIVERWNNKLFKATGDLGFRIGVLGGARAYANTKHNVRKRRVGTEYFVEDEQLFHWRFLEFGTENMAARPFMRPALANNTEAATTIFVSEYSKAIDRALKKGKP